MPRFLLLCCLSGLLPMAPLYAASPSGKALYQTYCAGCHGRNLEGVNGLHPLRKSDWIHGRAPNTMLQTILYGLPGTEMAAWSQVLTREQAVRVRDFVIEQQDTPPDALRELPKTISTSAGELRVELLIDQGLQTPWGIEFISPNRVIISERTGNLRWFVNGRLDPRPIEGLPKTIQHADAGLLDLALDPDYLSNGWVYLGFSHALGPGTDKPSSGMTRVIRGRIRDYQWVDEEILFTLPPEDYLANVYRWGCRLLFDREGYLYFSVGDHARNDHVQDLSKPSGKIYRINRDGSIPADNPFVQDPAALPAIYTIGNRNAQGLAQHPVTGEIWATEHGPMGGDELNILQKGANYGWPLVTFGKEYNGTTVSELTEQDGIVAPVIHWTPSIAVCPAEFYTGSLFPDWKHDLFVGALAYEELRRLEIEDQRVVAQELILKNYGRVRDLKTGPDGALYVVLNQPDWVFRLLPNAPPSGSVTPSQAKTQGPSETQIPPRFFVAPGLDPDGSLVRYYRRGLDYAIDYFGNYGPYNIYLLGPSDEASIRSIYQARACTRVRADTDRAEAQQISDFLAQPNVTEEIQAVLKGEATGGLTWTQRPHRLYEDVTTNATERAGDPKENTWGALHEYHHVFQIAHQGSDHDRDSDRSLNSWMLEGGATYSSALFMQRLGLVNSVEYFQSLYMSGANIGRPGIKTFIAQNPEWRLEEESYWESGDAPQVYYMLGAWATAYLIHGLGIDERTVLRDWYFDVPQLGKRAAFIKHMKRTPEAFYAEFRRFIQQPDGVINQLFAKIPASQPR